MLVFRVSDGDGWLPAVAFCWLPLAASRRRGPITVEIRLPSSRSRSSRSATSRVPSRDRRPSAIGAVVAGLWLSWISNLPSGATIVLLAAAGFLLAFLARRR